MTSGRPLDNGKIGPEPSLISAGVVSRPSRRWGLFPILALAALVLFGCHSSAANRPPRVKVFKGGTVNFTRFGGLIPNWMFRTETRRW